MPPGEELNLNFQLSHLRLDPRPQTLSPRFLAALARQTSITSLTIFLDDECLYDEPIPVDPTTHLIPFLITMAPQLQKLHITLALVYNLIPYRPIWSCLTSLQHLTIGLLDIDRSLAYIPAPLQTLKVFWWNDPHADEKDELEGFIEVLRSAPACSQLARLEMSGLWEDHFVADVDVEEEEMGREERQMELDKELRALCEKRGIELSFVPDLRSTVLTMPRPSRAHTSPSRPASAPPKGRSPPP